MSHKEHITHKCNHIYIMLHYIALKGYLCSYNYYNKNSDICFLDYEE